MSPKELLFWTPILIILHVHCINSLRSSTKNASDPNLISPNMDRGGFVNVSSSVAGNWTMPRFKNRDKMIALKSLPANEEAKFKCQSEGNPIPNITWYKNGNSLPERTEPFNLAKWSLMINHTVIDDSGNYTCHVCNTLGCIKFTYILEVLDLKPRIPKIKEGFPGNKTASINSDIIFECPLQSDFLQSEPYMEWIKAFDPISDTNFTSDKNERLQLNSAFLELNNLTLENEGWYVCISRNFFGQDIGIAYLTVLKPLTDSSPSDEKQKSSIDGCLLIILGVLLIVLSITMFSLMTWLCKRMRKVKAEKTRTKKIANEKQKLETESAFGFVTEPLVNKGTPSEGANLAVI